MSSKKVLVDSSTFHSQGQKRLVSNTISRSKFQQKVVSTGNRKQASDCLNKSHQGHDDVTYHPSSSTDTPASSERRMSSILRYNSQRSATPSSIGTPSAAYVLINSDSDDDDDDSFFDNRKAPPVDTTIHNSRIQVVEVPYQKFSNHQD